MHQDKNYRDMTAREFFAAVAIHGMLSSDPGNYATPPTHIAEKAAKIANAITAELNKPKEQP